jgi:uncharacterized HAD superfamily protein
VKHLAIGLDIDGVIVDHVIPMLPLLSEACGRPVSREDLTNRDLAVTLRLDEGAVAGIWELTLGTDLLAYAPPIEGAIAGLAELSHHDLWLVTRRPPAMCDLTRSWLAGYGVGYAHLVLDRVGDSLPVFVEDATVMAGKGVFTILLDQPWNQAPALPVNCRRACDWDEVVAVVREIERRRDVAGRR